jgi:hypothetical protein
MDGQRVGMDARVVKVEESGVDKKKAGLGAVIGGVLGAVLDGKSGAVIGAIVGGGGAVGGVLGRRRGAAGRNGAHGAARTADDPRASLTGRATRCGNQGASGHEWWGAGRHCLDALVSGRGRRRAGPADDAAGRRASRSASMTTTSRCRAPTQRSCAATRWPGQSCGSPRRSGSELAHLREQPDDYFGQKDELVCKFRPGETSGATPKFECVFENGELLKVKYGASPEIHTEVAATRLMQALGAGADRMYLVGRLRCFGCPDDPFAMLSCLSSPFRERRRESRADLRRAEDLRQGTPGRRDYRRYVDFTNVAIERQNGRPRDQAEAWRAGAGRSSPRSRTGAGARRATRCRLLAVFLNNWDNRADNQRLLCVDDGSRMADGGCHEPLAYMQDVGATFGFVGGAKSQRKLDVEGWANAPIWKDPRAAS